MSQASPPPYTPAIIRFGVFPIYTQHTTDIGIRINIEPGFTNGIQSWATDATSGARIFSCAVKALSLSGKKEVYDYSGALLTTINNVFGIRMTFAGRPPGSSDPQFTITSEGIGRGIHLKVLFKDTETGQEQELTLQRSASDKKNATITCGMGGPKIAHFYRHRPTFGMPRIYDLSIPPGVDAALMFSLCVCYDRVLEQRNN